MSSAAPHPDDADPGAASSPSSTPDLLRDTALAALQAVDGAAQPPGDASVPATRSLDPDKTAIIVVILLAAGVMAVIAVVVMNRQGSTQPQQLEYVPRIDVGMSSQEEIRSFTSKTAKEVTEIEGTLGTLSKSMEGLMKRQDDTEGLVRETLRHATETFASQGSEQVRAMEAYAQASRSDDPRTSRIIDAFRSTLANLTESPAEARAHAMLMLRQAGVPEERIRNLLAEASQQAGRLRVGDIAEAPLADAEVDALPDWVRPLVPALHDTAYGLALSQGRFYPQQIVADVRLSLRAHAHGQVLDPALCERITQVVRVRRENLPQELEAVLPYLVTQRDSRHLGRDDQVGIAHLIWSNRGRYPEGTTAGEMLSLCEVVARTIGATATGSDAGAQAAFRALDQATVPFAVAVVHAAMLEARQLGQDPRALGGRALGNYLDTMRMTCTPEQVQQVLTAAMQGCDAPAVPIPRQDPAPSTPSTPPSAPAPPLAPAVATPTAVSPLAPSAPSSMRDPDQLLYFGPLRLDRRQVEQALVFAIPALLVATGGSPGGTAGAAAVVGACEQVPRIVDADLGPHLGTPMGGLDFMQVALPQVMQAIHGATSLAGIPLPVSPQQQDEHSAAAQVMRGVAIGAIYGPLLHDQRKATAAAADAIHALERQAPLTRERSQGLQAVLASAPYRAICEAWQAVRPGQPPADAPRFQALVTALDALGAQARELEERLQGLLPKQDAGAFAENVRLVPPLAMAEHDDGVLSPAQVSVLVRRDLSDYAALFISESRLSRRLMDEVIPRYAAAMSEESGGGSALVQDAVALVPTTIASIYARGQHAEGEDEGAVVTELCDQALPVVERRLVQDVVLSRVVPRLRRAGALDQGALATALTRAESAVQALVCPPYTPARIDAWSGAVSSQGMAALGHDGRLPAPGANHGDGEASGRDPGPRRPWPAVTMLPTTTGGALVGLTTVTLRSRHIVIPASTYGNAHLQTGVDAEIGGRANVPVMLELDLCWEGPAGSRLAMRGCRVSGVANALAGPQRVAIDLRHLSYVFPSGRVFDSEIHGYVADNLSGEFGALGVYHWNADKVMPMAVVAGGFKGAADALKANSTTTIVGAAGTATVGANQGSQWKEAAFGGAAGGFGIMSDYVQAVLSQVHPSVSAVNGQSVSVVLVDPVEITVPEGEFSDVWSGAGGFAP